MFGPVVGFNEMSLGGGGEYIINVLIVSSG